MFSTRTSIITQLESQGGSSVQLQRSFSLQPTSFLYSVILTCLQAICSSFQQDLGSIWVPLSCATVWNLLLGIKLGLLLHCCPSRNEITLIFCPVLENSCLIYSVWLSTRDVITKEVNSSQVGEQARIWTQYWHFNFRFVFFVLEIPHFCMTAFYWGVIIFSKMHLF